MRVPLPPIDAHAHVQPTVTRGDLLDLNALVIAVTRDESEWESVLARNDALTIWGVGVHPGVTDAIASFNCERFRDAVKRALFIGEVGLDRRSGAPIKDQQRVFDDILAVALDDPRPLSIHCVDAHQYVLDALRRRPVLAPILHWWRGDEGQTLEAVDLGCFFSLNGGESKRPRVLRWIPSDRILTETDYPHSRRIDRMANKPAAVSTIETTLVETWACDILEVRVTLWRNLGRIFDLCGLFDRLPQQAQELIVTAGDA